jgi:hypothetical protein
VLDVPGESMDVLMGSCSQNTLKNKRLSEVSLAQKTKYADIRSRANTTRWLDFDHMIKQEHT